ncbi:MAG: hypothetical protein K9J17_13905 [Flavobacteriales bacterium]|nr:hypothetical protein [Flavobacteriales bacterium]
MNPVPFSVRLHIWLQRLVRWEFWPWRIVYVPVAVYWFFLAIKARGWVFFSAANPCMRFGGLVAYSKTDVTKLVPEDYLPKTVFVELNDSPSQVLTTVKEKEMSYPLIIKPDMGERGKGVKILRTEKELLLALDSVHERMLLQVYEDLPMELGVMYSRNRDEQNGKITSIVIKDFPAVIGDGKRTLLELILANQRTRFSYKIHVKRFADRLKEVIPEGEKLRIVNIGNHMLGTTFLNGNHLISPELEHVFDDLAKQIKGFHIGRFDVRTASLDALVKGQFKVIEVNGVNSEPCHIFHPGRSIFLAWRDLFKHWKRIADISIANHECGVPYASYLEIQREIRKHNREGAKHD